MLVSLLQTLLSASVHLGVTPLPVELVVELVVELLVVELLVVELLVVELLVVGAPPLPPDPDRVH